MMKWCMEGRDLFPKMRAAVLWQSVERRNQLFTTGDYKKYRQSWDAENGGGGGGRCAMNNGHGNESTRMEWGRGSARKGKRSRVMVSVDSGKRRGRESAIQGSRDPGTGTHRCRDGKQVIRWKVTMHESGGELVKTFYGTDAQHVLGAS